MTIEGKQGLSAEDYTFVYLRNSKIKHVIPNDGSFTALCRIIPDLWNTWLGTGSQREIDKAKTLRICKNCIKHNSLYDLRTTDQILSVEGR